MYLPRLSLFTLPLLALAHSRDQAILGQMQEGYVPVRSSKPSLADLLTIDSSVSIFFAYAGETELSRLFNDLLGHKHTLFVPTNAAVIALPKKP